MSGLAPILLFNYNRPEHSKKTVESLLKNAECSQSDLYIFSDGQKSSVDEEKIRELRDFLNQIEGFKSITKYYSDKNKGLANSIISGVSSIINKHKNVIVLEDDLECSPFLLKYFNEALLKYDSLKSIYCISGYNYPQSSLSIPESFKDEAFLLPRPGSWGWASWVDRWENVDWKMTDWKDFANDSNQVKAFKETGDDKFRMLKNQMEGKINSWAIRWDYHLFKNDGMCLYPKHTLIRNMGMDGSGSHSVKEDREHFSSPVHKSEILLPGNPKYNKEIFSLYQLIFKRASLLKRVLNKVSSIIGLK